MSERIEFIFDGRHFAVTYDANGGGGYPGYPMLEEFISAKGRRPYWREISPRCYRFKKLHFRVLHGRKKADFREMGSPLQYILLCSKAA